MLNVSIKVVDEGAWDITIVKPGCVDTSDKLIKVEGETNKQVFYLQAAA